MYNTGNSDTISRKPKPPTTYFGGKFGTIGAVIAAGLPAHRIYVEPYGGMAGVLFLKTASQVEVYNDMDSRIVNLFRVIRDRKHFQELKAKLRRTPFSREEYNNAHYMLRNPQDLSKVDKAWATFVALSMAIQPSLRHNGFRHGGLKYDASVARGFKNRVEQLDATCERLRDVVIENTDAVKLLVKYNSPEVCVYLDPPYVHSTRSQKTDYAHEMDDLDHSVLLSVIKSLKSKIIISGYPNKLYQEHLEGWNKYEIDACSYIAASINPDAASRTEVLYTNFMFNRQHSLFEAQ